MRWVTYRAANGGERLGLVDEDRINGLGEGERLLDLLRAGGSALADAADRARVKPAEVLPLAGAHLLAPFQPPLVRDFSTFAQHMEVCYAAMGRALPANWNDRPNFYFSNPHCVIGPTDDIVAPGNVTELDFELGVAAVVGATARDLSVADAEDIIVGFTIFNDCSARDVQRTERIPHHAKDFASVVGPYFVTKDELAPYRDGDRYRLELTAFVNGRQYSRDLLSNMSWSYAQMASYASRGSTLVPGDMLVSGTCATGCILELSATHGTETYPWLAEGDELVLTAECLGEQRNRISFGPVPLPFQ